MDRGLVLNIQRYSLHDGPGIRTTVFLKGCPLTCYWCHNPESRLATSEVRVIEARCVRCGECVDVCPVQVAAPGELPPEGCTRCGACVEACPPGARQLLGQEMTVGEVVHQVLRDRTFHDQSGGGVTLSGGEPLQQAAFVERLLTELHERSVHTAVDTSGFAPPQVLKRLASLVDLFLYDIKGVDDRLHRLHTGVSNQLILSNLQTLGEVHGNIWIRIPLIPGLNLDAEQLGATARLVATMPGVRQVNLLPYHRLGTSKLGKKVHARGGQDGAGVPDVTPAQVEWAAEVFRAAGLRTVIGG
jgi:pyruvate formate lyase activating enzyme